MFRLHKAEKIANGLENRIRYQKDLHWLKKQAKTNKMIFTREEPKALEVQEQRDGVQNTWLNKQAAAPAKKAQFLSLSKNFIWAKTWLGYTRATTRT